MIADGARKRICFPFEDRARAVGGSHISAGTLIDALDASRFRPTVVLSGTEGALAEAFGSRAVEVAWVDLGTSNLANPGSAWTAIRSAARYLRENDFDLVHTNEGKMHVIWGLAAKLAGVKHLWHHRGNPRARGLRMLAPALADRVVSVSKYAAPSPGIYSAARRCTVIHSPFDLSLCETDRSASRQFAITELGVADDAILVGYFGHFSERKRPVGFIEALAQAQISTPGREVYGLMFGEEHDPGMSGRMQAAIDAANMGDTIRVMGFRKPIAPWIAACDATLVPAVEEPFGRTLIEAMLLGTPVVAAASGGNIEAIVHCKTGMLAEADDPAELGGALAAVLARPELAQEIAKNAKSAAIGTFGIATHTLAVEAVYDELFNAALPS